METPRLTKNLKCQPAQNTLSECLKSDLVPKEAETFPVKDEPPAPSVSILAGEYPNLAEYITQMEKQNAGLRRELRAISDHYDILRAEMVEREARDLYGGFQAAACYKDMNSCRMIANARLRGKCLSCNGTGHLANVGGAKDEDTGCPHCEGCGYVEIPDLSWLKNGKIQFNLLPKEHPDYDPT